MTTKTMNINRLRWTALFLRFADLNGHIAKKATGLSLTQARIIFHAACHPSKAMSSIARSLNLKAPATTAAVDGMERLGLVRREVSPEDARSYGVYVTEKGYAQIPKLVEGCREAFARVNAAYGERTTNNVIDLMLPGGVEALIDASRSDKKLTTEAICMLLGVGGDVARDGTLDKLMHVEKIAWALQSISVVDAECGLGSKAAVILRATASDAGTVSLKDLRALLIMKPVAMTAQINFLEDAGLLLRSIDSDDRRLTLVSATDQGAALVRASRDAFDKCFDQCFPGLAKSAPPTMIR